MTDEKHNLGRANGGGWFASGGVAASILAFIGASCCLLPPIVLLNLGIGTALVGNIAFLGKFQVWFQGLTVILLAAGYYFVFRAGRPSRRVLTWLIFATVFAAVAFTVQRYEGAIVQWLNL